MDAREVTTRSDELRTWDAFSAPTPEALRPLLRGVEGWAEHVDGRRTVRRRELPMPAVVVMLQWGAPLTVLDGHGDRRTVGSFVAGTGTRWTDTSVTGAGTGLHVELHPLAARRVLGLPLSELTNRVLSVEELDQRWLVKLTERAAEAGSWAERFELAHTALLRRLADAPAVPAEVRRAWQLVHASSGRVPVERLAAEIGWSRRHLTARFREAVGVPPKAAARVVRFERARALLADPARTVAEVAVQCGYYDQPHLDRESREMAGVPASGVRVRTLPLRD
jgi:AraC-like DNA-binding protein